MQSIKNFEDVITNTNISAFVRSSDIAKGKAYDPSKIALVENKMSDDYRGTREYYHFEVDSESKSTYYDVSIFIENKKRIIRTLCDCKQYRATNSCKHIATCFVNYYETLFQSNATDITSISSSILDKFLSSSENQIKKELNVILNIQTEEKESYYYYQPHKYLTVKIMMGENKLYALGNHLNAFRSAYESNCGEVYFGKEFTYNPEKYYLSSEAETIINAYLSLTDGYSNKYFSDSSLKKFFYKLKNITFNLNNYKINGIEETFPIDTNLIKNAENYELAFDLENIEMLLDDYEYILYKGKMYHLDKKSRDLLEVLEEKSIEKLVIPKEKIETFTKGLLGVVKKRLNIDASVDDLTVPKDINAELYFDLRTNYILVEPKFLYDNNKIGYFDKNNNILRDISYETKVINDLSKYGFTIDEDKIILSNLDLEVEFLEHGLEELALLYPVFTTEKFKNMNIRKKTTITSMFGIGKNNILSYNFNLGDIKSEELVNIFKEIKNKKKYYRLQNGDILNLEDESLQQLEDLSEELELSDEEIIAGKGSILKYRAIYLDSLKNTKYNIINTDNLFDTFINKFYQFKDSELTLSKEDLSILRDYQVTGVKWLYNLDKTGFGGILADEMGLGKTIQVIYYIKQILLEDPNSLFLIVVPTSLAYNWAHEFDMYAPQINKVINIGAKDKRVKTLKKLNGANVLITTYGILREDEELYERLKFHTMIIDEAQNIKNNIAGITKCVKKIPAETKFALTGTPLENGVLELWSIFDFCMPGYLSSLTKFQAKYRIKDYDEDSEILLKGLSKQINPFILRRKKKDVIKELPDKLVNDIYIDLDEEQKKLYVAELERVKTEMENIINEDGMSKAQFLILQLLTKLRQLCIDPSIVYENYEGKSNKIEQLSSIVQEYIKNDHKILIFSSFKTALNIVKKKLNDKDIKTFMIDGSVPAKERMKMVDDFNEFEEVKVFLIMLKSGGTGLNLASADVVIHLDLWWNPQAENQATDRAHRIGQKNTVEVIHLITKGTIEEKILELQNKKRILSDKLIDGEIRDKNIISSLTEEDIKNLLSYENRD